MLCSRRKPRTQRLAENLPMNLHVHQGDSFETLEITGHKRTQVAQPGIIDQKIDLDFFTLEPFDQSVNLQFVGQIRDPNVHIQIRIATSELISHLLQARSTSRHQNNCSGTPRELPGEFAADSG
jgi:hypothetical protein